MGATLESPPQAAARAVKPQPGTTSGQAARERFVHNTWYVAMFSAELAAGPLLHRTILNEPIVFYRKQDGSVAAITDWCSHRFAPLSMGKLLPGDRVQCIEMRTRRRSGSPLVRPAGSNKGVRS
jgi:nitrite reductase/ring-hydroxylating ferredoxin subunit